MSIEEINNKRKELMELCKKHESCVGCPLDNEGCKALEILDKNPMDYESVFEYLREKEN
jgi:hypothetical protein